MENDTLHLLTPSPRRDLGFLHFLHSLHQQENRPPRARKDTNMDATMSDMAYTFGMMTVLMIVLFVLAGSTMMHDVRRMRRELDQATAERDRLKATLEPHIDRCVCGHEAEFHSNRGEGCKKWCACQATEGAVRESARKRRGHACSSRCYLPPEAVLPRESFSVLPEIQDVVRRARRRRRGGGVR